jgi:site-specific DNA-methyltransferase (adenine-specific)
VILDEEAGRMLDEQHKGASRFFYCAKASKKERNMGLEDMPEVISNDGRDETLASGNMPHNRGNVPKKNHHPTVKPIKLMEYLITLVTPPNGIVLDPFIGSGTTAIACIRTNRNYIGFELSEEYCKIANKRISKIQSIHLTKNIG